MSTVYLIDGYNLLYAMGIVQGRLAPQGLLHARQRLLAFLRGAHQDDDAVTIVFDAAAAPPGSDPEQEYHGLHISFAVDFEEADDMIEALIRRTSVPRDLHVVSDDHRIQQAARRRHCHVLGCADYLDLLDRQRRRKRAQQPERPEKSQGLSETETQRWLGEFGDLADDPDWKELFEPFDFEREDDPPR
jgi:predicted RNA-binding protein with PIN domain